MIESVGTSPAGAVPRSRRGRTAAGVVRRAHTWSGLGRAGAHGRNADDLAPAHGPPPTAAEPAFGSVSRARASRACRPAVAARLAMPSRPLRAPLPL